MAKEVKAKFRKKNGKYIMIGRKIWEMEMNKMFPDDDIEIIGEFRLPNKPRSVRQNSFYYGITIPEITEGLVQLGYDAYMLNSRVVNQYLEGRFLKVNIPSKEYTGEFITITKESKDLTTVEWMKFMENVTLWAAEFLKIELSIPNTQKEIDY